MFTATRIKEEPPLDINEDLMEVLNEAQMEQQIPKRDPVDSDNYYTVEEHDKSGNEMEFIYSDVSNQTNCEPNANWIEQTGIAAKLLSGELFLSEKQGRSKVWEVFAKIVDGDGLEIPDCVSCRNCKKIVKYGNKSSSNLLRHKCYILKSQSASGSKVDVDEATKKVVAKVFMKWIIQNCRPYNLVEDSGLQAVLQEFLSIGVKYGANVDVVKVLPRPTSISQNISELYDRCFQSVKTEIAAIKENGYGLTTDIWTNDYLKRSYIAVTMHFLKNGELSMRLLGMKSIESDRCTSENIFEKVKKLLVDFDCDFSFKSIIVTDKGTTMIKAFRNSQHLICIRNLLNYSLQKSMEEVSEIAQLSSRCSKLVEYFEKSGLNDNFNDPLKSHCPRRCHTVFYMLSSIEKNWTEINHILKNKNELHRIDSIKIKCLKGVTKTLETFEEAIKALEGGKGATLHLVLIYHHQLKKSCKSDAGDLDAIQRLKEKLLFYLDTVVKNNITIFHKLALFLYPPTNKLLQCSNEEKQFIEDECVRLLKCFPNEIPTIREEFPATSSSSPVSKYAKLFLDFVEPKSNSNANKINQELQFYKNTRVLHTADFNVFSWWERQKNDLPLLYKLSCIVLATPASIASSERIFATAGNLLSENRSELDLNDTEVNQITFIHSNVGQDEL